MLGAVVGETDGVIPALELTLSFSRIVFYVEGACLRQPQPGAQQFSLLLVGAQRVADRLVACGTRHATDEHGPPPAGGIQRGLLAGVAVGRFEGVAYFFNPGSDNRYYVVSVGVSF